LQRKGKGSASLVCSLPICWSAGPHFTHAPRFFTISGSPLKHIARLQCAQHALARVVLQERSRARAAPLMQQLHWLPIEWRIRFKLATLTYKALHTGCLPYLADLIQFHTTPKSTRSSSTQLLFVLRHNLSFGSHAFRICP